MGNTCKALDEPGICNPSVAPHGTRLEHSDKSMVASSDIDRVQDSASLQGFLIESQLDTSPAKCLAARKSHRQALLRSEED